MRFLRWIASYRLVYGAISALLVVLIMLVVGWQINQKLVSDRDLPLTLALGKLVSTVEGGTINSQAMGAAILFGLENQAAKRLLLGQTDDSNILPDMEVLRQQFWAKSIVLLNQKSEIAAYLADDGSGLVKGQSLSWPSVQLALQGTANVHPVVVANQQREIYLTVPVRAENNARSAVIGAFLIGIDAQKLDMVFETWDDGIVVLLSPKGVIFSSNQQEWLLQQENIHYKAGGKALLRINGSNFVAHGMLLEWNDPDGEWQLLVLSPQIPWWQSAEVIAYILLAGSSLTFLLWVIYMLVRHEDELIKSERLLKESQHIAAMGSFVLDVGRCHFDVSEETYQLFGIDRSYDTSVQNWLALVHPDDVVMLKQHMYSEVLARGMAFDREYRILRGNDQEERWIYGIGKPEYDYQGKVTKIHGTVQDITAKKQTELKLRQEHEQTQRYLDTTLAVMVELDVHGNITMLNRAACSLLGYKEYELIGRNWFSTCLPQPYGFEVVYPVFLRIMTGQMGSAGEFENTVLCRDGTQRVVTWRNTVRLDSSGNPIGTLSSGLDVTESRKLAQQLETVLERSPSGIAVFNTAGDCLMVNNAYARLLGSEKSNIMRQNFRNQPFWQQSGLLQLTNLSIENDATMRQDIEWTNANGQSNILECICSPITLSNDPYVLLMVNDVMARVVAERALNESLHKLQEKELAKTRFLAAAGHDLRQPIAAANLFVNALKYSTPSAQQRDLIQRLEQSMAVFSGLLECLLDISKLDAGLIQPNFETVALSEIFAWLDHNFSEVASQKKLRFLYFFPKNRECYIHTDRGLLKTVLMNLVSNALKFTNQGGVLISARPRGSMLLMQVWDTGIGISDAHVSYIFDEFYQVSNPQRNRESGLGLGLASCQRRMALLGGKVVCRSRLGKGSVFEIMLPLINETPAESVPQEMENVAPDTTFATGKHIVVIEDDRLLSDATVTVLQAMGATVSLFDSAEQALRYEGLDDADYFIADYALDGELSGLQFLQQVQQKLNKEIRAVLVTGETSTSFLSSVANCPWSVLYKPINVDMLARALG